jgi:hypothetical protein
LMVRLFSLARRNVALHKLTNLIFCAPRDLDLDNILEKTSRVCGFRGQLCYFSKAVFRRWYAVSGSPFEVAPIT